MPLPASLLARLRFGIDRADGWPCLHLHEHALVGELPLSVEQTLPTSAMFLCRRLLSSTYLVRMSSLCVHWRSAMAALRPGCFGLKTGATAEGGSGMHVLTWVTDTYW